MNSIRKISLTMALGLCLASCSILSGTTGGNKPLTSRQKKSAAAATTSQQTPAQQAAAMEGGEPATAQTANLASDLAGKVQGEWVIVAAGPFHISQDEEMPYLNFSEADGKFYSSNGCNVINGKFVFSGISTITFSDVVTTKMYCPDVKYEQAINAVLKDGASVTTQFENIGNETFLYLMAKGGHKVMTLRRHNMERLSGQWDVMQIGHDDIDNPEVNVFLDIADLTIHGNTGCNFFNGTIYIDADMPNSISFSQMAATMKACPDNDIEMAMLVALEQTHSYSISGNDVIHLLDQKGKRVMTLRRAQDTPLPTF